MKNRAVNIFGDWRCFYLLIVSLVFMACINQAEAKEPGKSDLKILYVGTDPQKPLTERDKLGGFEDRKIELRKTRAADFESFLNKYFDQVSVIYGDDFKEEMAADYDVTIIDTYLPAAVEKGGMVTDPNTGEEKYIQPKYLTEQYDAATVMIGEPSAFIGEGRQLKIDHLCLCLDAHAHSMKLDHAIFNTPYKVDVSYEKRETPSNYKARYGGRNLGNTMSMWRMQTEGYEDGKGFPIGLVSTGYGFDNGIDAEWISSGTCAKGVEATAIGRHANFFHWGFAAAPEYMTDSAKLTFINSIHYIAPFKGAEQVTRKIKGLNLRPYLRESQWMVSDEGSAAWLGYFAENRKQFFKRQNELKARQEAGESLTEGELRMVNMPDAPPTTREWTIRHEPEALKKQFGSDWAAYEQYYIDNMDYFYPLLGEWYRSAVDEDAKALGIANNDIRILDKAVEMLQASDQVEVAQGLLARYTKQSFGTADQWAKWLKTNRQNLYFSEGDGYKFIVIPSN